MILSDALFPRYLCLRLSARLRIDSYFDGWPLAPAVAHLFGVGGAGMRALAEFLTDAGWTVHGFDRDVSSLIGWAGDLGICLDAEPVIRPEDLVVRTAAISHDALELRGHASVTYPEVLAALSRHQRVVAVAGTHGKTTTASLLAHCLGDVSKIVGGIDVADQRSGRCSARPGAEVVVEACEYRRHFHRLNAAAVCLLNVEWDHPDAFASEDQTVAVFRDFLAHVEGTAPLVAEKRVATRFGVDERAVVFGLRPHEGFWPDAVEANGDGVRFVLMHGDRTVGRLAVAGLPRVLVINAVAAAAMATVLGRSADDLVRGIGGFRGVARRFTVRCVGETIWVDDYAHHPTAVDYVFREVRTRWPDRRLIAVFEPHQASRLRAFETRFARSLETADEVVIAPIFAAREREPDESATQSLEERLKCETMRCDDLDHVASWLETRLGNNPRAVVVVLGAGNIGRILNERFPS